MDGHESSEDLDADNLEDDDDWPDDEEGRVGEDSIENVNFIVDLSCADHVEDLHEDEHVENNGQMPRWSNTFQCFVHWILLSVLYHSCQYEEVARIPLVY